MQSSEEVSKQDTERRAALPALPPPELLFAQEREEQQRYRAERERMERRSVVRGLILLAMLALVGSMIHAGWGRVFVPGWWKP
jgi:hypothetical protein